MARSVEVPATITALTSARALLTLRDAGHDWEIEARRAGVPVDLHPEFATRVSVDRVERLFARGIELCGPDFPLVARPPRAEDNHSPINLYCRTRSSVREAVEGFVSLCDRITDAYRTTFEDDPEGGVLRWVGRPRPALWWFDLADALGTARSAVPRGPHFVRIHTPVPVPPGAAALFGCPIVAGPMFEVIFARTFLATRLAPSDPAVRALVERQVQAIVPPVPTSSAIVATLWSLGPTATMADLARAARISERTLHRRLAESGTSFRAELDAMRARLAVGLVSGRSTDEVAALLGYSDSGAYRRAARRWTAR